MNIAGLQVELWPIDQLIPYVRNARTHSAEQIAQVAASIIEFGWTNPILVGSDRVVIAGHARLLAARKLGMNEVPVIVLGHLSEAQRRALVLADNRLALSAGWDLDMLRVELNSLKDEGFDLELVGFSDEELEEILRDPEETQDGLTDEDAAPEAPERPVSAVGDLWVLGEHRVLCGDATDLEAVRRLMDGAQADLVFTDPPYNVDYTGYTGEKLKIQGDRMKPEEFSRFLRESFARFRAVTKPGASLYVCHASSVQREFQGALEAAGFEVRCQIIWAKNTFAWGFGRYKFQHEPIFYCHVAGKKDPWYGDRSQSTLWQEKKPAANRLHPTMKPVELIERALMNSSKGGDYVLDLFGGSGSTLIACQRRHRNARLMELDPKYADVIVRRWQEYTGDGAVLAGDDRSFDEVAAERVV
jgi:DNA modification methylase